VSESADYKQGFADGQKVAWSACTRLVIDTLAPHALFVNELLEALRASHWTHYQAPYMIQYRIDTGNAMRDYDKDKDVLGAPLKGGDSKTGENK
jgi:hypothetical protein